MIFMGRYFPNRNFVKTLACFTEHYHAESCALNYQNDIAMNPVMWLYDSDDQSIEVIGIDDSINGDHDFEKAKYYDPEKDDDILISDIVWKSEFEKMIMDSIVEFRKAI